MASIFIAICRCSLHCETKPFPELGRICGFSFGLRFLSATTMRSDNDGDMDGDQDVDEQNMTSMVFFRALT